MRRFIPQDSRFFCSGLADSDRALRRINDSSDTSVQCGIANEAVEAADSHVPVAGYTRGAGSIAFGFGKVREHAVKIHVDRP
jgi:hypothetical protein